MRIQSFRFKGDKVVRYHRTPDDLTNDATAAISIFAYLLANLVSHKPLVDIRKMKRITKW